MRSRWSVGPAAGVCAAALVAVLSSGGDVAATYISQDERIEATAQVAVQNSFFHNDMESISWNQSRHELRLGLRYFLVPVQQDLLGIFHRPRLSILWRGRYDAVFDVRDSYRERGYDRDDFRFPEGKEPRELFFDFELPGKYQWISARLGKQQVVWGEADLFRSLDVVNPLRLDQNGLIGENFDDYREPLWIGKFLFSLGELGIGHTPILSNAALELFYSPNWRPLTHRAIVGEGFRLGVDSNNTYTGLTRPNHVPFAQIRHPWEISRVGSHRTDAPDQADLGGIRGSCADGAGCGDFLYIIQDGTERDLFHFDASMFGARLFGQTFAGLDVSLNYLFKRSEVPGTALAVYDIFDANRPAPPGPANPLFINTRLDVLAQMGAAELTPDLDGDGFPDGREELMRRCIEGHEPLAFAQGIHGPHFQGALAPQTNPFTACEQVGFWYPWQHIVGMTATYNDFDYTGFIWRFEGSWSSKEPRNTNPPLAGVRAGQFPTRNDFETHIKRDTQVFRTMVGFDYLRALIPPQRLPRFVYNQALVRSLLTDQWFFTFQFFNEYYSNVKGQIGLLDSLTDRQYHFNPVLTYVMTGFFNNNRLRPFIAVGYDVNVEFPVLWAQFEYYVTPKLAVRIGDIEYLGSRYNESFLFLHKYADRDNVFARLTYYFL